MTEDRAAADRRRLGLPVGLAATLVLVRHGESTYVAEGRFQGRHDPPLSTLGERQALLVARRLAERDGRMALPVPAGPPRGIWHSPLRRAAQTAVRIADAQPTRVPLHATERLTELAQGEWEGQLMAEVRRRWPAELAAWRTTPAFAQAPGGERLVDGARRVAAGLREVIGLLAGGDGRQDDSDRAGAAASERYDPVPGYPSATPSEAAAESWAVLVAHDGIFRLCLLSLLDVPLARFWSFPFNLCTISVIALQQGVATLRAHNLSEHLAPLADEERAAEEARGERRGAL